MSSAHYFWRAFVFAQTALNSVFPLEKIPFVPSVNSRKVRNVSRQMIAQSWRGHLPLELQNWNSAFLFCGTTAELEHCLINIVFLGMEGST